VRDRFNFVGTKGKEYFILKQRKKENKKDAEGIDLDKIKKYFENVLSERHFMSTYAKTREKEGRTEREHDRGKEQIKVAK